MSHQRRNIPKNRSCAFNTFFWIDRTAGIGAVVATQLVPFFDGKMIETILGFEAAVYAQLCRGRLLSGDLSICDASISPVPSDREWYL